MRVYQGRSTKVSGRDAIGEATASWGGARPDLVLAFASTRQDGSEVVAALRERFPRSPVAGCTTAGEIGTDGRGRGGVVVTGLEAPEMRFSVATARGLSRFEADDARAICGRLFEGLGVERERVDPERHVCLAFLDGLSKREEAVAALLADELEGAPLVGGSAGDDLAFRDTRVFSAEGALRNAGVLVMIEARRPFSIVKHQHYTTTARSLVITRADVGARRVFEMDGYPALEAYARALGRPPEEVTDEVTFMNPLALLYGGEIYVRSIQRVEPDGSLSFYCGIEEGMVLSLGGHQPMTGALARDLEPLGDGSRRADLLIACNCILRALEAEQRGLHAELGAELSKVASHVAGFDTYGEQLNGLHINQTLVALALRGGEEAR